MNSNSSFNILVSAMAINSKKKILLLCTGNSCRSQIAEGLVKKQIGTHFEVFSAGTIPKTVDLRAIETMNEIGIDISNSESTDVNDLLAEKFDLVITLCDNARENCPLFPGDVEIIHIGFNDPAFFNGTDEEVRLNFQELREAIQEKLLTYLRTKFSIVE